MLRQEQNLEEKAVSAAQTRVTPEELAAAITRIEARKDSSQRNLEGTVSIGEVVQQLGLDATPEEVLAEVQAGRKLPGKQLSAKERLNLYVAVGALITAFSIFPISNYFRGRPSYNVTSISAAPFVSNTINQPSRILLSPDLMVSDASGKLVMLSEVRDNQPVHCDYDNGGVVLNGIYYGGKFQQYVPGSGSDAWTLLKHKGRIYVRGWMPKISPKALQTDGADIRKAKDSTWIVPVTLPINGFTVITEEGGGSDAQFHAQNLHLDNHAWEKW